MYLSGLIAYMFLIAKANILENVIYSENASAPREKLIKQAITYILDSFYTGKNLYITTIATDDEMEYHLKEILTEVLISTDSVSWYLEFGEGFQTNSLRYYNIILIDSYEAFGSLVERLGNAAIYDATGYYLIVLLCKNDEHYMIMQRILSTCWNLFIVNVNILVEPLQELVYLYSYYPYTPIHCGFAVPVIVNSFINETLLHEDIFPKKFYNLHNCTLSVVTWENPPFILIDQSNGSVHFSGIEGTILENLANAMNFSLRLVAAPKQNPRGFVFANGSATGSFGILQRREANITLGCYRYSEQRVKIFGSTHPYYQAPLVIATSKGAGYSAMDRLFYPFKTDIWISIMAFFVVAVVVIVVLRHFTSRTVEFFVLGVNNTTPLYNMWVSSFGGQTNHLPRSNFARFVLMLWVATTLVIRSSYQGALYDFIRMNTEKEQINTLADLADNDYVFHIDPPTEELVENEYLRKIYVISTEPQHEYFFKLQRGLAKAGIMCPHDYVKYFNNMHSINGTLHVVKERVVVQPVATFFPKSSFLMEPFAKRLWIFSGSGLLDKWTRDFIEEKYSSVEIQPVPRQFSNVQLAGAYELYLLMIGFAVVVFIIELVSMHTTSLKRIVQFLVK